MEGYSVWLLAIAVFAPLVSGLVTLFLPRSAIFPRVLVSLVGPALAFGMCLMHWASFGIAGAEAAAGGAGEHLHEAAHGAISGSDVIPWIPMLHLNIAFLADGLGMFFALLVSGIGCLIVLYARGYFGQDEDDLYRFYPTLGFFTTAMMGIVLADYTLLTLLFWEMTSISSFLLIGWDRYDKKAVKLAMQAFFTTGLGGMGLLGGILLFGFETDIWRWSDLLSTGFAEIAAHADTGTLVFAFVLMFFGAATKSAQYPWHYWLPGAMAAPTPVSAFLHSATMVKAGVFLIGRLFPIFSALAIWPWLIVPIGALTMMLGALIAINQHDLKRIFAYTTVSQLGLLMCMYGLGAFEYHHAANIDYDITQIANHAFYKAPLFILAGALGHVASRQLPELHGAFKKHKAMCIVMLLAGYALAAGPGTISFQAKEMFLYAVYHAKDAIGGWWIVLMAMTVVTAVCNVAIFIRLFTTLLGLPGSMRRFHGEKADVYEEPNLDEAGTGEHEENGDHADAHGHGGEHHHEGGLWGALLWLPAVPLVALQYFGGLWPGGWESLFGPLETNAHNYLGEHYHGIPSVLTALTPSHWGLPLGMSVLAIVLGIAFAFSRFMRGAIVDIHDKVYPAMYWLAVSGGGMAFRVVQRGNLRSYMVMILGAFMLAFVGALWVEPEMFRAALAPFGDIFEFWPGILLGLVVCASAISLPLTEVRVVRVILLGACGFSVVGLYIVLQAPDLALTQMMFEIISVLLFVLVLRLLPGERSERYHGRLWRGVVGAAVGITFGMMTLIAATTPREPLLGKVFSQGSYQAYDADDSEMNIGRGGGGNNIVNVILVDFRGFDTLGEITVLSLAALGVWSMLPGRRRRTSDKPFAKLAGKEEA